MNPLGFAYSSVVGVEQYAQPTGMVITGRHNRNNPAFQAVRAGGGEVLAYVCVTEIMPAALLDPTRQPLDVALYEGVATWPYLTTQVNSYTRTNADGTTTAITIPVGSVRENWYAASVDAYGRLADIRPGSPSCELLLQRCAAIATSGQFDGLFLDVVGARLWGQQAGWLLWPEWEQRLWTDANVFFVQELRHRIGPGPILVNNGTWMEGHGRIGERFVNGSVREHHAPTAYHVNVAARPYGFPEKRRMLIIARNQADAVTWSQLPGVTHVSDDEGSYLRVAPPPVPFTDLRPPPPPEPPEAIIARLEAEIADLENELAVERTAVAGLVTRVADLTAQNSTQAESIAQLQTALAEANARIASLQAFLDAASTRIEELLDDVATATQERDEYAEVFRVLGEAIQRSRP